MAPIYRSHVEGLASDEMQGREPGSEGERKTIEYLEKEFLELGLQPVTGGDFRQDVALVEITGSDTEAVVQQGRWRHDPRLGDDMVIGTRRVQPESAIAGSEVVFVGYGIHAPEFGWNDYAGIDMRGKTALILVNDPGLRDRRRDAVSRQGDDLPRPLDLQVRGSLAQGRGGERSLSTRPRPRPTTGALSGIAGLARSSTSTGRMAMPAARRSKAGSRKARARQLMELAGQDFDAMKAAAVKRGFKPVPLGVTATGGVRNAIRHKRSPNLAGLMPGKDRPDEYVIYVAHWDHLGVAEEPGDDRIYNGAVDNATGVAGILTIARGFRNMLPGVSRSVLFIAVTAEESGLIGSEYYAEKPLVPLEKTAAVINIDAIQPLGRAKDIEVIGFGASDLEDLLATAAKSQNRTLTPDLRPEAGYFYRSDHFNFAKAGVPALYIKSGTQLRDKPDGTGKAMVDEYYATRYHKPEDEYSESWDVCGSIEDLRLLFEVGARVANAETWPEWREGNEFLADAREERGEQEARGRVRLVSPRGAGGESAAESS